MLNVLWRLFSSEGNHERREYLMQRSCTLLLGRIAWIQYLHCGNFSIYELRPSCWPFLALSTSSLTACDFIFSLPVSFKQNRYPIYKNLNGGSRSLKNHVGKKVSALMIRRLKYTAHNMWTSHNRQMISRL